MHDELARRLVEAFGGQLMKTTGDGILATFDGPDRGIRCAAALRDELGGIGLQLRAGLHTGEVELRDGDVGGIAVHVAARVLAAAQPSDLLVAVVRGSCDALPAATTQRGTWQPDQSTRPPPAHRARGPPAAVAWCGPHPSSLASCWPGRDGVAATRLAPDAHTTNDANNKAAGELGM